MWCLKTQHQQEHIPFSPSDSILFDRVGLLFCETGTENGTMPLTSRGSTHWWANPTVSHSRWRTGHGLEGKVLFNPRHTCGVGALGLTATVTSSVSAFGLLWVDDNILHWTCEKGRGYSLKKRERALGSIFGCGSVFVHLIQASTVAYTCVRVCDPYDAFHSFFFLGKPREVSWKS